MEGTEKELSLLSSPEGKTGRLRQEEHGPNLPWATEQVQSQSVLHGDSHKTTD